MLHRHYYSNYSNYTSNTHNSQWVSLLSPATQQATTNYHYVVLRFHLVNRQTAKIHRRLQVGGQGARAKTQPLSQKLVEALVNFD